MASMHRAFSRRVFVVVLAAIAASGLALLAAGPGEAGPVVASWYGPGYEGAKTSSGEPFDSKTLALPPAPIVPVKPPPHRIVVPSPPELLWSRIRRSSGGWSLLPPNLPLLKRTRSPSRRAQCLLAEDLLG